MHISTENNEEINEISDTDQDKDNKSTSSCSTKKGIPQNRTTTNDGKLFVDCPMCVNARLKILNGKSRTLVKHMENCEGN